MHRIPATSIDIGTCSAIQGMMDHLAEEVAGGVFIAGDLEPAIALLAAVCRLGNVENQHSQ